MAKNKKDNPIAVYSVASQIGLIIVIPLLFALILFLSTCDVNGLYLLEKQLLMIFLLLIFLLLQIMCQI